MVWRCVLSRSGAALVARVLRFSALGALVGMAGCGHVSSNSGRNAQACLARAMYFESVRSSDEGMLAVGTVVMNRLESGKYPDSVCGVVGQKNQFAPGVLSKSMTEGKSRERAFKVAGQVLNGKRHRAVGKAMFFHTAGRTYRFENMHYVAVAGGNAFYERRPTGRAYIPRTVIAQAGPRDAISAGGSGFQRSVAPGGQIPEPVVARATRTPRAAPPLPAAASVPAQSPPGVESIEAIILASNGF